MLSVLALTGIREIVSGRMIVRRAVESEFAF
jgi:hypothetical protein